MDRGLELGEQEAGWVQETGEERAGSGVSQGKKLTSVLGGQPGSFLDFLVAQNKIKWPWISTCTYMNVPLADFIRVLT